MSNIWLCYGFISINIFGIEKVANEHRQLTKGSQNADYVTRLLQRFFDDVLMKWRVTFGDLQELFNVLNSVDEQILFTIQSGPQIPFLQLKMFEKD